MSSLLQSNQPVTQKGAGILVYLTVPGTGRWPDSTPLLCDNAEEVDCLVCGKKHAKLYRIFRKPVGTFGHWVVFRINGEEAVPDLSTPLALHKKPRGAVEVDSSIEWHR
jgi:hypothetical protein